MSKNKLPYDKTDRTSIFNYAIELRGSTLREKTDAEEISDIRKNKGSFGSAVETYYFMLDANSESEADFSKGKLAATTPIAKALIGHGVGEIVEAQVPAGILKFKILEISL